MKTMNGRSPEEEITGMVEAGYVPCGLAIVWETCPRCKATLGRFRAGEAGQKWFRPADGKTRYTECRPEGLRYCRACRRVVDR